mmetsp:Transcript_19124/g.28951  ORF Transcript_19124/g.28951 Transcript_19124/m.28951 type:complete len:362 (+) Transcript_19124:1905-2990(+)
MLRLFKLCFVHVWSIFAYRPLPTGKLIVGYAPGCSEDGGSSNNVIKAVQDGVNVVIWSFIEFLNISNTPQISTGPNITCVKKVVNDLNSLGFNTSVHMISIGGWDSAHPSPIASGFEWFNVFKEWNQVYDGIDWDLEGNDNLTSPYNALTNRTLQIMNDFSIAAKNDGAIVSLVPPQSYLDTTESRYDTNLTHTYLDWHPDFHYRGRNAYAPLLFLNDSLYDFVSLQLYESWSRCAQAIEQLNESPVTYLIKLVRRLHAGWLIDYRGEFIRLSLNPAQKLVLGFSAGSADASIQKSIYISPSEVALAYNSLPYFLQFRGAMYWNVNLETCYLRNGSQVSCDFAAGFNSFLHVQLSTENDTS